MASEYCTFDEVCEALGMQPQQVKGLVAEGRLHEFRDAGKVFYKRNEIDQIAAKEGSSIVDLVATEDFSADDEQGKQTDSFASALSSLADSSSSGLGVLDESPTIGSPGAMQLDDAEPPMAQDAPSEIDIDEIPVDLPAAPKATKELSSEIDLLPDMDEQETGLPAAPALAAKDAEVPDFGLSGSSIISLETGLDEVSPAAKLSVKETAKSGKPGISVFDDDEVQIDADPMGETRISAGVDELETVGSGSGLLDLTQESDDTSLGAALLDVISPSEAAETEAEGSSIEAGETVEEPTGSAGTMAETDEESVEAAAAPAGAVAMRPAAMAARAATGAMPLNICALVGILSLALVGLVTAGQLQGVWPSFVTPISKGPVHWSVFGGLAAVALGTGIWGILADRK